MKVINTIIYECDYCGRYYKSRYHCERHELLCKKNPENERACFGCANLSMKTTQMMGYMDNEYDVKILHCSVKDEFVYPPQVAIKGNALDTGDMNRPMPKECDKFLHEWEA